MRRLAPGSPARLTAPDDVRALGRQILVYTIVGLAVQMVAVPFEIHDASAIPDEVPTLILWLAQLVNRLV